MLETAHKSFSEEKAERYYAFGFSLYQSGSFLDAAKVFQMLCLERPLEAKYWFALASSLQQDQKYEKALSAWLMAAILDAPNPYPHFHAAECAFSLDRMESAFMALEEACLRAKGKQILQDQIAVLKERWSQLHG